MNLRNALWSLWIPALAVGMALAQAQAPPAPFLRHTFEENESGWTGIGQSAKVAITHEAKEVKEGKGALKFDYNIGKGEFNAMVLPTPDGALTKLKSLKFWIKTDHTTPVIVSLSEKEGGHYNATFTAPGGKWQKVELAPSDFTLGTDENDPKDPDNKLDLDKVESVSIGDLGQFFAQIEDANLAGILIAHKGAHTLLLDEFAASEEALPDNTATSPKEVLLDKLMRPQLGWMAVGEAELSIATGKPLSGQSLKVEFKQKPDKLMGLVRAVSKGQLAGMDQLAFTVAAAKPMKMLVQVEEVGGGKYNTMIDVPGNSELKEFWLPFADFTAAQDSKDTNGKLDLDQVKQVLFLDANLFTDKAEQDNTLWINKLRAAPK